MAATSELVTSGSLILAVPVAFAAGVVSFLSPCCLPLVPGYLSYVTGAAGAEVSHRDATAAATDRAKPRRWVPSRTVLGTALFVLGFSAVFTSYGAAFGGLGRTLVLHQRVLAEVLGSITITMGLLFLGAFNRIALTQRTVRLSYRPAYGLVGAPALGVLFGIGWTPCIGPTLAAVLSLSLNSAAAGKGAFLAFTYSLGLGLPFLAASMAFRRGLLMLPWARRNAQRIMQFGGLLLVTVGFLQVSGLWGRLVATLQTTITGFQPPI